MEKYVVRFELQSKGFILAKTETELTEYRFNEALKQYKEFSESILQKRRAGNDDDYLLSTCTVNRGKPCEIYIIHIGDSYKVELERIKE